MDETSQTWYCYYQDCCGSYLGVPLDTRIVMSRYV